MPSAERPDPAAGIHATLLIASGCPHCPSMIQNLSELLKAGKLARLEIINLSVDTQAAQTFGVRSVPWLKLGELELEGVHSRKELETWLEESASAVDSSRYLEELLGAGKLEQARDTLQRSRDPETLIETLLGDSDAELQMRIALGALIEEVCREAWFAPAIPALERLTAHTDARVRNDACYYLGLTGHRDSIAVLRKRLEDEDADVRESAQEAIDGLAENQSAEN